MFNSSKTTLLKVKVWIERNFIKEILWLFIHSWVNYMIFQNFYSSAKLSFVCLCMALQSYRNGSNKTQMAHFWLFLRYFDDFSLTNLISVLILNQLQITSRKILDTEKFLEVFSETLTICLGYHLYIGC